MSPLGISWGYLVLVPAMAMAMAIVAALFAVVRRREIRARECGF